MRSQTVRALCSFTCLILLLAAGCINYDQQMELNSNGSGKMVMHYSMASQLVSMMQMGGSSAGGEGENEMPFKLKEEEVKADLTAPGVKVEKFETKTEGDQQHFYVHLTFDNVTSLNKTKTFKDMQITWKEDGGVTTFSQILKAKKKASGGGTEGDEQMGKQMAQAMFGNAAFKYNVKFPSKVLPAPDTNGTISEDGTSVSWNFPLVEMESGDKVMTAKFKSGGLSMKALIIIAGAAFLTLIGLIGIILMMRKK